MAQQELRPGSQTHTQRHRAERAAATADPGPRFYSATAQATPPSGHAPFTRAQAPPQVPIPVPIPVLVLGLLRPHPARTGKRSSRLFLQPGKPVDTVSAPCRVWPQVCAPGQCQERLGARGCCGLQSTSGDLWVASETQRWGSTTPRGSAGLHCSRHRSAVPTGHLAIPVLPVPSIMASGPARPGSSGGSHAPAPLVQLPPEGFACRA